MREISSSQSQRFAAANDAAHHIIWKLEELKNDGSSEDALVLGALFVAVDAMGGAEGRDGLPEPLYQDLRKFRDQHR